jgi:hypothetical protein
MSPYAFINRFEQIEIEGSLRMGDFLNQDTDQSEANDTSSNNTGEYLDKGKQKEAEPSYPSPISLNEEKLPQDVCSCIKLRRTYTDGTEFQLYNVFSAAHERQLGQQEKRLIQNKLPALAKEYVPLPDTFKALLDLNFDIGEALVYEILSLDRGEARVLLLDGVLPYLDLDIRALDLINHLIMPPGRIHSPKNGTHDDKEQNNVTLLSRDEAKRLVHVFISNRIRQLETSYNDLGTFTPSLRRDRSPETARKVQVLCLFIMNLLRNDIVSAEEIYFEVQNLFTSFVWVKEAKELHLNVTGGTSAAADFWEGSGG